MRKIAWQWLAIVTVTSLVLITGSEYVGATADSTLVHWWPAENSGSDVGTTPTPLSVFGATFAAGKVGQAFSLNGSSAFAQTGSSQDSNAGAEIVSLNGSYTVTGWFRTSAPGADMDIFAAHTGVGGGAVHKILIEIESDGRLRYLHRNGGDKEIYGPAGGGLPDGEWHHFAAVQASTTMTLYVDGVVVGTTSNVQPFVGVSTAVVVGKLGLGLNLRFFNGRIDEIQVYNRALSAAEVAAQAGPPVIVHWWPGDGSGTAPASASLQNEHGDQHRGSKTPASCRTTCLARTRKRTS